MKSCLVSFNGLGEEGPHAPAIAPLILRPLFLQAGWECEIFDAALLARDSSIEDTTKLINTAASYLFEFDLVGITTRCDTYPLVLALARKLKEIRPQINILLGGPQATATAKSTMKACSAIDLIIKSEAESCLPKLLLALDGKRLFSEVPGLIYRGIGGLIQENAEEPLIKDLGVRPFPDYDYYAQRYKDHLISFHEVELGRGCPFKCNFCFTTEMWRREYRVRDPSDLAKELKILNSEFGTSNFHFIHDNLIIKKGDYINSLINSLDTLGRIQWGVSSRMDTIDTELIPLLSKVGLTNIFIGIETGNNEKKIDINKRWPALRCQEVVNACNESSVSVTMSFIVGFPNETRLEIENTIYFAIQCLSKGPNTTVQFHSFALEAGTPLLPIHISNLNYTGYHGDHIRIPWKLGDEILNDIKGNPEIYSTFFSLNRENIKLPYAIQDILGPALNLFRKTFLKLVEIGVSIKEFVDVAINKYERPSKPVNRGLYAYDLIFSFVDQSTDSSVRNTFSFEASCYFMAFDSLAKALEHGKTIELRINDYAPILHSEAKIFSCLAHDNSVTTSSETIPFREIIHYLILPISTSNSLYSLRKLSSAQFQLLTIIIKGSSIDDAASKVFHTQGKFSPQTLNHKEYQSRAKNFILQLVSQGIISLDQIDTTPSVE